MKTYYLKNKTGSLTGSVIPDYGGMMSELYYHGIPIFHFDPALIGVSNILAGGNPVLFPFPSRTKDDRYYWQGKQYSMPFHGLVKCAQFGLIEKHDESVTLYVEPSEVNKEENYPFDFRLEVSYALRDDAADFTATVVNRSQEPMPHCFGWHPWFKSGNRQTLTIRTQMKRYLDYSDMQIHDESDPPDFMKKTDYIFDGRYGSDTIIDSVSDGYSVRMETEDAFDVLAINTEFESAIALEPWMGLPDSINTGDYLKFVPPGESRAYRMTLHFR